MIVNPAQIMNLRSLGGKPGGLRISLLGPLQVEIDGKSISLPAKRVRALLTYLVQREGTEIARSLLTGLLWGERGDEQARASLRQALSELRAALAGCEPSPLNTSAELVTWAPGAAWIDSRIVESAASGDDREALVSAAQLIRGEFLEGFALGELGFEEWLTGERERYRQLASRIYSKLIEAAEH